MSKMKSTTKSSISKKRSSLSIGVLAGAVSIVALSIAGCSSDDPLPSAQTKTLNEALDGKYSEMMAVVADIEKKQEKDQNYISVISTKSFADVFGEIAEKRLVAKSIPDNLDEYRKDEEAEKAIRDSVDIEALRKIAIGKDDVLVNEDTDLLGIMRSLAMDLIEEDQSFSYYQKNNFKNEAMTASIIGLANYIRENLSDDEAILEKYNAVNYEITAEQKVHASKPSRKDFINGVKNLEDDGEVSSKFIKWGSEMEPSDYVALVAMKAKNVAEDKEISNVEAKIYAPTKFLGYTDQVVYEGKLNNDTIWLPNMEREATSVRPYIELNWNCGETEMSQEVSFNIDYSSVLYLQCEDANK